ncbi:MAG TPA: LacI family DNA-binding transcriptional regulator [Acidimicrobiia bacterium]|jgi:LacI family transcriptional regulator
MDRLRKVTLRDIAERAGVHVSTVSRALDPSTTHRVNAQTVNYIRGLADELGYRPDVVARGLREGRTATIGVVVADLGNPFIAPILRGIENNLESRGSMAIIAETQDDRQRFNRVMDHLLSRQVDAIITTAARDDHVPLLNIAADRIPVVLAVRGPADSQLPRVTFDDVEGGRLVAEHLLDLGHRRIGHVRGPGDASPFVDRAVGFSRSLGRAGVNPIEGPEAARRPTIDEGDRLMKSILSSGSESPSAVFAHNDLLALGALRALGAAGIQCPDSVHVVGYDDTPIAAFSQPALTSVRHPSYELGRMAADYAITLIENVGHVLQPLAFPPTLVVRESSGGPPER